MVTKCSRWIFGGNTKVGRFHSSPARVPGPDDVDNKPGMLEKLYRLAPGRGRNEIRTIFENLKKEIDIPIYDVPSEQA